MNKKGTMKGEAQPPLLNAELTAKDNIDLFLLAGQSNMKGRAEIDLQPNQNKNIVFFHSKELQWYVARDPLHAQGTPDLIDGNDNSGTGPAMSFAKSLIGNYTSTKIGLIPAAVGGAPIDSFSDKGEFYHRSLKLLKQCKETSKANFKLKAILWLQGESDSTEDSYQSYEDKLLNLVDRYREDLQNPNLPFIACTIGSFVHKGSFLYAKEVNHTLKTLPKKRKYTSVVDARDLEGHNGDHLHYDLSSQLEIGKRFANAYHALAKS